MQLAFTATVFTWRGPSPYYFVAVPEQESAAIDDARAMVTYGWGMVPVTVSVGDTEWTTSLWPKDEGYYVPLRAAVRRAEGIEVGAVIAVVLSIKL